MSETALRIIPCLDLRGGRVVKGVKFQGLVDAGDPGDLALRYEAEGADEIALLDIDATVEGRATALAVLSRVRSLVSIPIAMGGGIRTEEDASRLLDAGADRVSVNSAAVADPGLVEALAARYGVQCVVLAIDARRREDGTGYEVVVQAGRKSTGLEARAWAAEGARRGAGEILLTSIDRDGTGEGYDLDLVRAVAEASGLPVVASGGARTARDFVDGAEAGARALLAAGIFHRGEVAIGDIKTALAKAGREIRS